MTEFLYAVRKSALALGLLLPVAVGCGSSNGNNNTDMGQQSQGDMAQNQMMSMPTITSITPSQAATTGGTQVTITGTSFQNAATVKFAGIAGTNVMWNSNSEIVVTVPAYSGQLGRVTVEVTNQDGGKAMRGDLFSYVRVPLMFAAVATRTVGTSPAAILADDIDGDNAKDLIVANRGDNTISVLRNNMNLMPSGGPYTTDLVPTALAIADMNGDSAKDILVGCSNNTGKDLDIFRSSGVGTGSFVVALSFPVATNVTGLAARDLNGDGKADVVASVRSNDKVYVLGNNTSGGTIAFLTAVTYATGAQPVALLSSDITKDGNADILTVNSSGNSISALNFMTGGTFGTAKTQAVGMSPLALAAGDFTGDLTPDVVVANNGDNTLSLLKGQGDGTFTAMSPITTAIQPSAVALAKIDSDANLDLIVANAGQNQINIYLGKGDGTFEPVQTFFVGLQPFAMAVADLNGDGKNDIATANLAGGTVSILYNQTN